MAERQELGVYAISVVAQLVGTGQQNIRLYERKGLLTPDRTAGGTRQYSNADLAVLRRISELLEEGLNLAGVAKVLELEAVNARLQSELNRLAGAGARNSPGFRPPARRWDPQGVRPVRRYRSGPAAPARAAVIARGASRRGLRVRSGEGLAFLGLVREHAVLPDPGHECGREPGGRPSWGVRLRPAAPGRPGGHRLRLPCPTVAPGRGAGQVGTNTHRASGLAGIGLRERSGDLLAADAGGPPGVQSDHPAKDHE